LYISLSKWRGVLRLLLGGITGVLPAEERFDDAFIGVEGLIGQQDIGFHLWQQRVGAFQIVCLTTG